jgi:hypothetical protein
VRAASEDDSKGLKGYWLEQEGYKEMIKGKGYKGLKDIIEQEWDKEMSKGRGSKGKPYGRGKSTKYSAYYSEKGKHGKAGKGGKDLRKGPYAQSSAW